jgi:histidinol-phosphatase
MVPPAPSLDDDLALAHRLVDLAAEVALEFFHRGVETIVKEDNSPVSEADLEVDRRMLEVLVAERPDDAVLSEESGAHGGGNRRWILDPIDGTFNFVEGRPAWGTHVALEVDGDLVLGVISRPVYELRYWATRGGGAYKRGTGAGDDATPTPLQVSTTTALAESRVTIWSGATKARLAAIRGACVLVEPATLDDILAVAEGELEAVIDSRGKIWDHAPAVIIVTEAGGAFRDREGGRRPDLGTSRYTNGRIDDDLHGLIDG